MRSFSEEKKLLTDLKRGKEKSFKKAYFLYYDHLIEVAKHFNFQLLTPDDFVHETFLRVYEKRELLKEDVALDKQLFVICKNLILNHLQREQKVIRLDPHFSPSSKAEEFMEDDEVNQQKQLQELIKQLPEQRQKIFVLHKIHNYSYQEIMEYTHLSPKTIANHIYLANQFILKKVKKA
ncbi:RNA polymerase sigma factor [Mesonia aestuariivivens]|uniref:Sigma-70 family RNA polymerase sigma factor n=1 Tax=Mesonia aestuariivivens TaxID=2796128 RepID=A0ABS6W772_9FLAO|nr:sigma-70 family RNA polymerase sigma factor [Mesonia aestuariivivens]MBW2962968.1 sigma-70 family RNA polymerase sigma factor [Mesonia aestuariivivens]